MIKQLTQRAAIAVIGVVGMAGITALGTAHAEGLYVGGNVGTPDYRSNINGITGNGGGPGLKVYGGYQFTPNFAVEAGAFGLGHIDDASGKARLRGLFGDAVGSYEFAPKWSVLGRAGLAEGRFTSNNGNDTSPALKLGAGLQYDLTKQIALRAEYEHYHFTSAYDAKANVGEFSLGVKFGF